MSFNHKQDGRTGKIRPGRRPLFLVTLLALSIILFSASHPSFSSPPVALIEEINLQKMVNGFDKNIIKQGNVVYDPSRNKVYVSGGLTESTFAIINPETDTIEDLFDMRAPGGIMALGDHGKLYIVNTHNRICSRYDPETKSAEILPDQRECQQALDSPKNGIGRTKSWNGYALIGENTWDPQRYQGFAPTSTQDLNGLYNKIKLIYNRSEKAEIIHGPDTMFFDIDTKHGKIYASNTGDASISVFDLKKLASTNDCKKNACWVKDIDLGTSIDEILLDSSRNIYIRNRLGGSTIYKYNQSTKRVSLFADNENNLSRKQAIWNSNNWNGGGINMWPTGFALSQDGKEMYVFSHFNASIDIINTANGKFLSKLIFPVPWKPRTDSLSEITMDYTNNRMFGVWPELGLIGVADLTNRRVVSMIDLQQFGFNRNRALNKGLGVVKLAYNPKSQKLYIFLSGERKLIMLDGKTFHQEKVTQIAMPQDPVVIQFNGILLSNPDKSEIYLGNHIFDSLQLTLKNSLPSPSLIIVGFNNQDNSLYVDQMFQDRPTGLFRNTLYKFVDGKPKKMLPTGFRSAIPTKYYFDFPNNIGYAYFMAEAKIMKYDLVKMQDYNNSSNRPE